MSTIDEARPSAENLRQRLDFETLVSELSSGFINLSSGELDGEIEVALRRICEILGVELAILWQSSRSAPDVIAPTHVYHGTEGPRPSEPMRQDQYPWARRHLLAGRMVVVSSLEEMPAEAAVDRETCRLLSTTHGGVSQVPGDGSGGPAHQRRIDPLRHQARPRRALTLRPAATGQGELCDGRLHLCESDLRRRLAWQAQPWQRALPAELRA